MDVTATAPKTSILRRTIVAVLFIEVIAALILIGVTAAYERHVRFHAFDDMLEGRANTLFSAVQDANDEADNVALDTTSLDLPTGDLYLVQEEVHGAPGKILGRSSNWDDLRPKLREFAEPGFSREKVHGHPYLFLTLRGTRVVDADEGITPDRVHHILIRYGSPLSSVTKEILEAVRFYTFTFALVLLLSSVFLAWSLRRSLSPLRALATAAGNITATAWHFQPPSGAWTTRELAPLTLAMEASVQRLQRSFEQQRRFSSDAAHELKTDVAIIKSSLQLLTMRDRSLEAYREGLALSLLDCERLERTVQEMLTLARVEHSGNVPHGITAPAADLSLYAREACASLAAMAALQQIQLVPKIAAQALVTLSGQNCRLLCINLMQNAIQHSPPGGTVMVSIDHSAHQVSLLVEDQGEGIESALLPYVCEPFYRADDARDRKHGGTGLGLAICKAICENAGGALVIASEVGKGTHVCAILPMSASSVST